jgi:hypothetical protein
MLKTTKFWTNLPPDWNGKNVGFASDRTSKQVTGHVYIFYAGL